MTKLLILLICLLVLASIVIAALRKKKLYILIYPMLILALICVTILSDESHEPIRMKGCNLKHDVGWAQDSFLYIDESNNNGYGGPWARMDKYALNKGTYTLHATYGANLEGNMVSVVDDGEYIAMEYLPITDKATYDLTFTLEQDSQEVVLQFNYLGIGSLFAYEMELESQDGFYNDAGYYVFVLILIGVLGILLYLLAQKKNWNEKAVAVVLLLTGIGLMSFVPYMNGSLDWGDDLCYHLIRIEGIKDGLRDGQLPVMIYPEGLKGYGYTNLMYPSLFLYIPAVIRLFGVSMAASYKTLILLACLATAFLTYWSIKSMSGSAKAALIGAGVYTLSPYRLTNLYARGALGEALALTFLPLLLAGLYHLLRGDKKKWWVLSLALTGLCESHVLSMTIGAAICVVAAIVYIVPLFKEKRILEVIKAAGLFLLLNLTFLVPFLSMYKGGGLWMAMLGISGYEEYSLEATTLFGSYVTQGYRILGLGLSVCVLIFVSIYHFAKRVLAKREDGEDRDGILRGYNLFLMLLGLFLTLLILGQFRATKFMELAAFESLFKTLQFPWRLLGVVSAIFAVCGSIVLFRDETLKKLAPVLGLSLVLLSAFTMTRYYDDDFSYENYTSTYTKGHQSKIIGVPKSNNTIVYPYEWRQEGVYDNVLVPAAVRTTDSSQITIDSYSRKGTTTILSYTTSMQGMEVELPVLWYPGYQMKTETGDKLEIFPGSNNLVAFACQCDGLEHTVTLTYHKGFLYTLCFLISMGTVLVWIGRIVFHYMEKRIPTIREDREEEA